MNSSFPRQKLYSRSGNALQHSEQFVSQASNQPVSLWQQKFDFKVQDEVQTKLSKILSDKPKFMKTSVIYFGKFDKDDNKNLDYKEFKDFLFMLTSHFQLPPLSEQATLRIFHLYEKRKLEFLSLTEFQKLFWNVLKSIQKVFFIREHLTMPRSNLIFHFDSAIMPNIKDLYIFEKKIGSGTFGKIHIVREICTKIQRACKLINFGKSGDQLECLLSEVEVLKALDHPNIVRILEVIQETDMLYIITEICCGGELAKKLNTASHRGRIFTEPYASEIMEQLLEGINYMHSNYIVHRDLKPENILFSDSDPDSCIKIIDFGLAERFCENSVLSNQIAGTCYYMAPEVFSYCISFKCDIWSLGCILFQMLTNELPFPGDLFETVQDLIINSEPDYSHFNKRPISSNAIDLVKKMLQKNPKKRPTAKECLNSPWFRNRHRVHCFMSSKVIQNLRCYQRLPILKRIFLNMLTHQQGIRKNELFEINNLFRMLDKNRNGVICREKFAKVLLTENLSIHTINDIFNAMDIDNSGVISYTEFASACVSWNQFISIDGCQMIFNKMDTQKKKYTTYEQVANLITRNSKQVNSSTPEELLQKKNKILKLIQSVDAKNKGYIDFETFLEYMLAPSSAVNN